MVVDSSAIVAVHLQEPGYQAILEKLDSGELVAIGTPTVVETAMVLTSRLGKDAGPLLNAFLSKIRSEIVSFDEQHAEIAVRAFIRFGSGRHPAALNYGDCLSYAVASLAGMPLLFTGNDFVKTDIVPR